MPCPPASSAAYFLNSKVTSILQSAGFLRSAPLATAASASLGRSQREPSNAKPGRVGTEFLSPKRLWKLHRYAPLDSNGIDALPFAVKLTPNQVTPLARRRIDILCQLPGSHFETIAAYLAEALESGDPLAIVLAQAAVPRALARGTRGAVPNLAASTSNSK
jgi:hypothetical protein